MDPLDENTYGFPIAPTKKQEWKKAAQESTAKICTKMLFLAGGMLDILDKFTTRCGKRVSARIGMGRGQVVVGALGASSSLSLTHTHTCTYACT